MARGLDFSRIFYAPSMPGDVPRSAQTTQDHGLERAMDVQWLEKAEPALERGEAVSFIVPIRNVNRSVGAMLSGEVARRYTHAGLPDDTIHVQCNGTAGQSFGAFLARGITLDLVGEANDYVGKGLSGGRVIVRCANDFRGYGPEHIIVGNTVLYGATEGEAYINGVAGERFAVRNSGALAVVEGTGDHGCEYMTGGTVVVLGRTGRNFAAGMSGGVAYVFDPEGDFSRRCNTAMVDLEPVLDAKQQAAGVPRAIWHALGRGQDAAPDEVNLRTCIEAHFRYTGSSRAKELLSDWARARMQFVKVFPSDYRRALGQLAGTGSGSPARVAA